MFCIIGEVDKFTVQRDEYEFIKYSMSEEEIKQKLKDNKLDIVDNSNNTSILEKMRNNVPCRVEEDKTGKIIGASALYCDMITKKIVYGEIELSLLRSTLMRKDLQYCFIGIDNNIEVSKDVPIELLEVKKFNGEKFVKKKIQTELSLDVINSNGDNITTRIPADFLIPILIDRSEGILPVLCKDLELALDTQESREINNRAIKLLRVTIKDILRNGFIKEEKVTTEDYTKYGTSNAFKLRLIKTVERRLGRND